MAEYIEREALIAKLQSKAVRDDIYGIGILKGLEIAAETAKRMPYREIAADVVERKRGRWTENEHWSYDGDRDENVLWFTYTCSQCGGEAMNNYNFCPNCGADMREV